MPKDRDNLNFRKYTIGKSEKPENDTKFVTVTNSCYLKKVAINPLKY